MSLIQWKVWPGFFSWLIWSAGFPCGVQCATGRLFDLCSHPGGHICNGFLGWIPGSTIRTLLHGKINPKDWQVLSLGDVGFLLFFRVVSGDYGEPWIPVFLGGGFCRMPGHKKDHPGVFSAEGLAVRLGNWKRWKAPEQVKAGESQLDPLDWGQAQCHLCPRIGPPGHVGAKQPRTSTLSKEWELRYLRLKMGSDFIPVDDRTLDDEREWAKQLYSLTCQLLKILSDEFLGLFFGQLLFGNGYIPTQKQIMIGAVSSTN